MLLRCFDAAVITAAMPLMRLMLIYAILMPHAR